MSYIIDITVNKRFPRKDCRELQERVTCQGFLQIEKDGFPARVISRRSFRIFCRW